MSYFQLSLVLRAVLLLTGLLASQCQETWCILQNMKPQQACVASQELAVWWLALRMCRTCVTLVTSTYSLIQILHFLQFLSHFLHIHIPPFNSPLHFVVPLLWTQWLGIVLTFLLSLRSVHPWTRKRLRWAFLLSALIFAYPVDSKSMKMPKSEPSGPVQHTVAIHICIDWSVKWLRPPPRHCPRQAPHHCQFSDLANTCKHCLSGNLASWVHSKFPASPS